MTTFAEASTPRDTVVSREDTWVVSTPQISDVVDRILTRDIGGAPLLSGPEKQEAEEFFAHIKHGFIDREYGVIQLLAEGPFGRLSPGQQEYVLSSILHELACAIRDGKPFNQTHFNMLESLFLVDVDRTHTSVSLDIRRKYWNGTKNLLEIPTRREHWTIRPFSEINSMLSALLNTDWRENAQFWHDYYEQFGTNEGAATTCIARLSEIGLDELCVLLKSMPSSEETERVLQFYLPQFLSDTDNVAVADPAAMIESWVNTLRDQLPPQHQHNVDTMLENFRRVDEFAQSPR